ncbi:MAG: winged helix-turn-helix transcriptional regulator [Bacteroides pyogenes]|nr:winged helix-turn-helix transcriptional regulator [Bacteroides pyogenes]
MKKALEEKLRKKSPRNIEDKILDEIKNFPQVTRKDLAKRLNRTEDSIRYYLRRMVKEGVIKHEGPTKAGKWIIIK